MNLMSVHQQFSTEDEALDYLVKSRWPDGVRCISCAHDKAYAISTEGKTGKPCRLHNSNPGKYLQVENR